MLNIANLSKRHPHSERPVFSGLGLSVSYGIVTAHRGTIAVQSTPGVGTTFTIRLPRHGGGA